MKLVRKITALLPILILLASCATPTPIVVVVTATSLPPTELPPATLTPPPAPIALAGPKSGEKIKWIDGSSLIFIPASDFIMGDDGFDSPVHTLTLDSYWIQETKVTNRMFAQCVAVGACTPPTQVLGGPVYSNPEYANHPVVGVTWDQAQTYCGWIQGGLPSEAQWEKAARGTGGNIYPWGNTKPECELLNSSYCVGHTTEVNIYEDGRSPYGLFDMGGNTYEWVYDWYSETYYSESPTANPAGPDSGQFRAVRGSSFETYPELINSALRHYLAPSVERRDTGFRCAVLQPQPIPPYCQTAAYIPVGFVTADGCQLPDVRVAGEYCQNGKSFITIDVPQGALYDTNDKLDCTEAVIDGQRRLTCLGASTREETNPVTVCNPTCSNSPDLTGAEPVCDPGYTLDPSSQSCNYTPILGQVSVSGCPTGYTLLDRGGQQSCVINVNANGQCPVGLYLDTQAGICVPPNGVVDAPYGIDNGLLAQQYYGSCASGYSYSDTFQCCQATTGGTYPGCPPGSIFDNKIGACSPGEVKLSGPGCVELDVTTVKCSQPVDICSKILSETHCLQTPYACRWNEAQNVCVMK